MFANQALLYIDPGTGSMLFSILIGAFATLFFLFKALWLKVKLFFSADKKTFKEDKSYKKYVIYCEDKRYWTVFKPILDEFETRQIDVTYYTSSKDDGVFGQSYKHVAAEYIGEGNTAYAKLNLLSAGIVVMSTPGLDVYQLKRSKNVKHYSHIFHSPTDSSMYRLFGLDFFDSVLMTGDYQAEDIRFLENLRGIKQKDLVTVGCTYLDLMQERVKELPPEEGHKFTVLVSPTWGKSGLLTLYGERLLDPLVASGFKVIIRPHPQSKISEKEMLDRLAARYKDAANVEWNYDRDNIHCLNRANIMISDFSGIIFDYTFLFDKPVIYANAQMDLKPYDAWYIKHELWEVATLHKMGIAINEADFGRIKEVIQNASDSPALKAARDQAKAESWQHIGEAGKRAADYMIGVVEAQKQARS